MQWVLYVAPSTWTPAWRDPMIAVVVVVSLILAFFLFILLLSRWVGALEQSLLLWCLYVRVPCVCMCVHARTRLRSV